MPQPFPPALEAALAELDAHCAVARLRTRDHTLWGPSPAEIADRLGWLAAARDRAPLAELAALADRLRAEGTREIVLLGMGGSSLGAEMLRQVCGGGPSTPRLQVLDSTVPAWVARVEGQIDPARTLVLVSSKSGSTAEVAALFARFWHLAVAAVGTARAGERFAAITDPGTSLAALAAERGFRQTWINDPEIGGRFSVLSLFGLVPAALVGLDAAALLTHAEEAVAACLADGPAAGNPGARLGAAFAAAVRTERPLLTLLADRRLAAFGLWAEQLVAESLGKNGVGIVPVTGEPLLASPALADRRLFVRLRLAGEREEELDRHAAALAAAGHPLLDLSLDSPEALGGEIYRWEVATALAGHLLGVQPFDQPDVESTKRATRGLLERYRETGSLPEVAAATDLRRALADGPAPAYVALLGYCDETPEVSAAIDGLRRRLASRLGLATTFGFGPRYLHSTGQLHKGGPKGGLFVQLVGLGPDLPIPGEPFGFATLARAQADGDLLALAAAGRRTVRIELAADPAARLAALAAEIA